MKNIILGKNRLLKKLLKSVNIEQVVICILVVVLVGLVLHYVNKNNEGFNDDNKPTLYFFHVDWCGFCKKAKPVIDELENNSEVTNKVNIKRVNCEGSEEEKALAKENGVNAYPTIILKNNNGSEPTPFESGVTQDGLIEFVNSNV